jgi:hypothetical protein
MLLVSSARDVTLPSPNDLRLDTLRKTHYLKG